MVPPKATKVPSQLQNVQTERPSAVSLVRVAILRMSETHIEHDRIEPALAGLCVFNAVNDLHKRDRMKNHTAHVQRYEHQQMGRVSANGRVSVQLRTFRMDRNERKLCHSRRFQERKHKVLRSSQLRQRTRPNKAVDRRLRSVQAGAPGLVGLGAQPQAVLQIWYS